MTPSRYQIGIIGAGNMGEALIRGLLRSKLVKPKDLIASGRRAKRCRGIHQKYKVATTQDNIRLVKNSRTIILAIKPQDVLSVLPPLKPHFRKGHLLISVVTGVDTKKMRRMLGAIPCVRVSPNLPALIGSGVAGIFCSREVRPSEKVLAHKVFEAIGKSVAVPKEKWLDAITGLSGTGPAYVFALMEALIQAGQKVGLPKEMAKRLTLETMLGAARMVIHTELAPELLRAKVTSKKGTTWMAMKVFKKHRFWSVIQKAVQAATKRAQELRGK